uniref:Putative secreted protein n=1 Tax=Anopheles marajoara TaxID=58244 RepID=A0A2M4C9T5_9DIPT
MCIGNAYERNKHLKTFAKFGVSMLLLLLLRHPNASECYNNSTLHRYRYTGCCCGSSVRRYSSILCFSFPFSTSSAVESSRFVIGDTVGWSRANHS